jgi:hypothetical protein
MNENRSTAAPVAMAVLLALPLLYVGSYFAVSGAIAPDRFGNTPFREFPSDGMARFYWPLLKIESSARGETVETVTLGSNS